MTEFGVGATVWYSGVWETYSKGKIVEIRDSGVKVKRDALGYECVAFDKCFSSKKELADSLKRETDLLVDEYCSRIKSVEDLVEFCYNNTMVVEEYTNWEARKAGQIMAKKLLGLELEY